MRKCCVFMCVHTPEMRLFFTAASTCTSGFLGRAGLMLTGGLMAGFTLTGCCGSTLQLLC